MTILEEALSRLEPFFMVGPGPTAKECLKPYLRHRSAPLSILRVEDGKCCWCNLAPVEKRRRRYCSANCIMAAWMNLYPQSPQTKAWILIHIQGCSCPDCGEVFEGQIIKKIQASRRKVVSYHWVGDNTGELQQVDHIDPIFKGGVGIGLSNIQVLCAPCHLKKTVWERRPVF